MSRDENTSLLHRISEALGSYSERSMQIIRIRLRGHRTSLKSGTVPIASRPGGRFACWFLLCATAVVLVWGLAGCGCGDDVAPPLSSPPPLGYGPGVNYIVLDVSATDAAISRDFGSHYAYVNPDVSPKGKLFVFMPATGSYPSRYLQILRYAGDNGFHAIGLAYDNSSTVEITCSGSADPSCHGKVREEILTGQNVSPLVSVDKANSVDNRLTKALLYLAQQYPEDGWAAYLDTEGNVQWSLVNVGGHSQGGGEAGYIAKQRMVSRVCFFSSPGDFDKDLNKVAAWVSAPGVTPVDRYYGFYHQRDPIIPSYIIQQVWPALQVDKFGGYVDVDSVVPPYRGSHMLATNRDRPWNVSENIWSVFHNITVMDEYTPFDLLSGLPTYRFAWQYLCFQ